MSKEKDIKIAFFGTDKSVSITVLEELVSGGYTPSLIITAPDRPQGRKMVVTPPPVKVWAVERDIPVLQPEKLDSEFVEKLKEEEWDLFITASYGQIIPKNVIEIPTFHTLNVHPSLLPLYRGATPVESAILDDQKETGVTIIRMDDKMDHGPIIAQEFKIFKEWPTKEEVLSTLAKLGGELLVESISLWVEGNIDEQEQGDGATYTKKIEKSDGEIKMDDKDRETYLKFVAYIPWPGVFFFVSRGDKKIRVKVTEATWNGEFVIQKVVPEGKKEMDFEDFKRSLTT